MVAIQSASGRFEGTVAIVTGAGRGIGRATALGLAAEGALVTVNDLDAGAAASVVEDITSAGGQAIAAVGSVTDVGFLGDMVDKAESEHGRIGVVVNNAGIVDSAMALKMGADQWHRVLDVNLTGAFNVLQAVGPSFVAGARRNRTSAASVTS